MLGAPPRSAPPRARGVDATAVLQPSALVDDATTVGAYSYVGHESYLTKAVVGRYASIGPRVSVGLGEHRLDRLSTSSHFYGDWAAQYEQLTSGDCRIGHDAWLGVGSVILRGTTVGLGAVVGANAVVTRDVPPFAIAVGVPAKVIRYRLNPRQIEIVQSSSWWEMPIDAARRELDRLQSVVEAAG